MYSFACESACKSNAIGMHLHTYVECQGCVMFSPKHGRHCDAKTAGPQQRLLALLLCLQPWEAGLPAWQTVASYHATDGW
jgi:hypothetical protein